MESEAVDNLQESYYKNILPLKENKTIFINQCRWLKEITLHFEASVSLTQGVEHVETTRAIHFNA